MSSATIAEAPPRAWVTATLACQLLGSYPARLMELVQQGKIRTMTPPAGRSARSRRRYALADVERLAAEATGTATRSAS